MGVLRTALYCRLSKEDMAQGDSESIKTQKAMLTQYAREHGFLVVEVYVDDGWSGLNFHAVMLPRSPESEKSSELKRTLRSSGMSNFTYRR